MSWPTVKLGALLKEAALFTDGDWVESKDQDPLGSVRLIQLADVGNGYYIDKSSRFLTEEAFKRLRCTELLKGDILIARMPEPLGRACIFPGDQKKSITVVDVCIIRVDNRIVDAKWLMYSINMQQIRDIINKLAKGATRIRISKKDLGNIEFPLPPLAQQKRIAAILDKADEIKRKREQAIAKLDQLAQSIFVEMFGDPVTNPKNYSVLTLENFVIKITDGEHINPNFVTNGMPIIMAGNVLEDSIEFDNAKRVSLDDGEKFRKKCKPEKNDLLVVSRGATIGRMTVVNENNPFCLMGSVILIKLEPNKVNPIYLSTLLKFPIMRSALYKTSGSSAQQAIYLKDLKNLLCILPSIERQTEFSKKILFLTRLKHNQFSALDKHNQLFASLQNQAFTGQL